MKVLQVITLACDLVGGFFNRKEEQGVRLYGRKKICEFSSV